MARSNDSGPRGSAFALTLISAVLLIGGAQATRAGVNVWTDDEPIGGIVTPPASATPTPAPSEPPTATETNTRTNTPGPSPTPTATPTNTPTATAAPTCNGTGIVGSGSADGCTEIALESALACGGSITFNCGPSPATITITSTKTISADTIIDGGSLITISGGNSVGVFSVNTGITLRVQNLTIANGRAAEGGGIWNSGTVTVSNSTFAGNSAITGGGIYNPFDGILTLTNCTLSGNSAGYGGAIANEGTVTLANSALSGNSASVSGGAITNFNTATLTDCALSGNSASGMGGAIVNISLSLTLTNCTLNGNAAGTGDPLNGAGGAIFNLNGTLTLTNSTLSGNSAPRGGGMANACVSPVGCGFDSVVVNSTFSGNHADAGAGAIDGPLQTSVTNSIIANSGGANCGNGGYPAAITDGGHNLQWPGTGCGNTIPSLDPMLDPGGLRDNGGPTQTIALLPNSPVINAGDEAVCAAAPVNGLDQRGYVRPGTGATRCSIGAYEFDSPGPPPCDGDCNNDGHVTIDELLTLANIALGGAQPAACSHGVPSGIEVGIALILQAVNNALTGCGG